jgi:hypothetical protein
LIVKKTDTKLVSRYLRPSVTALAKEPPPALSHSTLVNEPEFEEALFRIVVASVAIPHHRGLGPHGLLQKASAICFERVRWTPFVSQA